MDAINRLVSEIPDLASCRDNSLRTPIWYAACYNRVPALVALMEAGCDFTSPDLNGETPYDSVKCGGASCFPPYDY